MTSSRRPERRYNRAYTDDFDSLQRRNDPRSTHPRHPPPRYEDEFDPRPSHPSRRKTYQEPREHRHTRYQSLSPAGRDPQRPAYDDSDSDYFSPRRASRRDEKLHDDKPHDPRHRQREERPPPRQGFRSDYDVRPTRRERPGRPARRESRWQKEAKDMFDEYAVPVIKKEGARFLSKQLEKMIRGNA